MRRITLTAAVLLTSLAAGLIAGLTFSPDTGAAILVAEDLNAYRGQGLKPGGGDGTLDSQRWAVVGLSDGDTAFGEHSDSGDLARGKSDGGVRSGGLYAFALPNAQIGLGVQATASDFSPGALLWRFQNDTAHVFEDLRLEVSFWNRNDGNRSTRLAIDVGMLSGNAGWQRLAGGVAETPGRADSGGWQEIRIASAFPIDALVPDATAVVRFSFEDAAGSGGRDEIALEGMRVLGTRATAEPVAVGLPATAALALPLLALAARPGRTKKRVVTEA